METIWGINVEARNVVYDYRMIFYIRGKKKKKISVRIFGLSRNPTHPYVKTNSLYQTTKEVEVVGTRKKGRARRSLARARSPFRPYFQEPATQATKIAQLIPLNQTSSTSRAFDITFFSEAYDHSSLLTFKNFIDG